MAKRLRFSRSLRYTPRRRADAVARCAVALLILIFGRTSIAKYALDRIIRVCMPLLIRCKINTSFSYQSLNKWVATLLVPGPIHSMFVAFCKRNVNEIKIAKRSRLSRGRVHRRQKRRVDAAAVAHACLEIRIRTNNQRTRAEYTLCEPDTKLI